MGAYEVFAFWNGADVNMVLNAVAAIIGGGDYLGLMKGVALVGLISAATYALLAQRGQALGGYLAGFVFVYGVIFVPKVDVIVNDVRAGTTSVVSNVPLGLAMPYATLSHIGYWLTLEYESRFTTLDDERFSKTGMVFGARVLETLSQSNFPDPGLKADVITFYQDCVVPELMDDPSKAKLLRESKDIGTTLAGMMNPARGTALGTVTYLTSKTMSCDVVPTAINTYMAADALPEKFYTAQGRINRANYGPGMTNAVMSSVTETDINNMLGNLLNISDTALQALNQSMWINGINDADMAMRNGYGNAAITSYTVAATDQSVRQSAYAGKMWADKALPLIRNIAEFILIAIFPLMFIIMLVAGENALMALKLYLGILASLALWAPLTAILNYQVIINGKAVLGQAVKLSSGFTINNLNSITDLAMQQQALAGQLFLAVPVIAYALVSAGAYAATSAMGSLTSAGSGAASRVSGEAALGNVGGGQVGWRNTNALNATTGQTNTAQTDRSGFYESITGAGNTVMGGGAPGGGTFNARTSSLGSIAATATDSVQTQAASKFGTSSSAARSAAAQAAESMRQVEASGHRSEHTRAAIASFQAAEAATSSADVSRHLSDGQKHATAAQNQMSHQGGDKASVSAGLGVGNEGGGGGAPGAGAAAGGGAGPLMRAKLGADYGKFSVDSMTSSTGSSGGTEMGTGVTDKKTDAASSGTTLSNGASNSASNSDFAQRSVEKAKSFATQGQAQAQAMQSAERTLSAMRSSDGSIRTDMSQKIVEGMGGAQAASDLYASNPQEFAKQASSIAGKLLNEEGLSMGSKAPSTSAVEAKASGVESDVAGQIKNAPMTASAPAAPAAGGARPAARSHGGKAAAASNSSPATPATPDMPASVRAPSGDVLQSKQVQAQGADMRASTTKTISDGAADVSRKAARESDDAKKR